MAYSCVKVIFEIGHEATVRPKKTSEGYTHDWEIFIRGADNTDIQHFVDRVVFHLHETFPNPKRVVKDSPYSVQESGYAGFVIPVDVYLRSKSAADPNKIRFSYPLTLPEMDAVQPLTNVVKETHTFSNPTEDFRRKLIKGGGVGVNANSTSNSHSSHMAALNSSHSTDDHKTSGSKNRPSPQDVPKKSKKESSSKHEERLSSDDPFAIFGDPIFKKEIPYTTTSKSNSKPISDKVSQPLEKQAHSSSKSSKYNSSSHKDKDRDKDKEKEKEREKDKLKDREKEKEKTTNPKKNKDETPVRKEKLKDDKDKILKSSKEDSKMKNLYHEEKISKEKEKEKSVEKFEKEPKVEKKDREKKHKDEKKLKSKEKHKNDKKENIGVHENYAERNEKPVLTKEDVTPIAKEEKRTHKVPNDEKEEKSSKDKSVYSNGTLSTNSQPVVSTFDNVKKDDKHKHHKHKEKKSKKEGKREKEEKKEKIKEVKEPKEKTPVHVEPPPPPKSTPKQTESPRKLSKRPLKTLFDELTDKSDSDTSSDDDMNVPPTIREPVPNSPESPPPQLQQSVSKADTLIYTRQPPEDQTKDDTGCSKRKKKKTEEKETNKRKRKSKHKVEEDAGTLAKVIKYDEHHGPTDGVRRNATPTLGDVPQSRQSSESPIPLSKFTEEYITKLKELQHKIMSLDDNSGLQRIVQVVAETGQYEITTKTFDFDLCSLDEKIVQRLFDLLLS